MKGRPYEFEQPNNFVESKLFVKQINEEIQNYESRYIEVVPGLHYNQYETLKRIYFYYNSKFSQGGMGLDQFDEDGDRKYFYNIVRNPCKVFTKAIDFDTKNIRLLTTESGNPTKTWLMERDLKYWMRDKQFGKVLNRIFRELPIYGTVILKIVNGYPYFVDLRNFIVEQSADTLKDSNYITEIHNFTEGGFRKAGEEMGWPEDKIDEAIKLFREMKKASHIRVYERYGYTETADKDGKVTYPYKRVFWANVGEDEWDEKKENLIAKAQGVTLKEDDWTEEKTHKLYWEFHKDKIPGRFLGVGLVEELFEPQIRQNEIANTQAKATFWRGWVGFQTKDQTFNRNLKTGMSNGETVNVDSEVTQINVQEQNGAYFNEEARKWQNNRDELAFSYDAVQGERSPAGTPLGSTQISVAQTLSYFEGIQEEVAMDIKEMIYSVIMPQFQKEASPEHTLRIIGDDLEQYIAMVRNELTMKEMIRQAVGGKFPNPEDKQMIEVSIEEAIRQEREKMLEVPKDFYKDAKYDIDIDITGESVDTRVKYATRFAILQAISSDPTMLTDPTKKKILFSISEDGGLNPFDWYTPDNTSKVDEMVAEQNTAPRGGGVSAPQLGNSVPGQSVVTV